MRRNSDFFSHCLGRVLSENGRVANDRKHGVSLAELRGWKGNQNMTQRDLDRLTYDEAVGIFRARYWDSVNADGIAEVSKGMAFQLFDFAAEHGIVKALRGLGRVKATETVRMIDQLFLERLKYCVGFKKAVDHPEEMIRRAERSRNYAQLLDRT